MKSTLIGALKSKTIWLAAATIATGIAELPQFNDAINAYVPAHWLPLATSILGALTLICRFITSQSLAEKGGKDEQP